jgi:NADPH-dependent 2,4-dienoyl-CoA reductase/sulfur reductase-like enzyme
VSGPSDPDRRGLMRTVIAGAGLAGTTCAVELRRAGVDGPIVLLGDEPHAPYSRPSLSKEALAEGGAPLGLYGAGELDDLGIELRPGAAVLGLDVAGATVTTSGGDEPYDRLVVATGSHAVRSPAAAGLPGVTALRTRDDALRIAADLRPGARVIAVGGGVLASELAAAAAGRGAAATILARSGLRIGAIAGPVSDRLAALHRRNGVDVRTGTTVAGYRSEGTATVVLLTDGTALRADLVVEALGVAPSTGWLAGSGLPLAADGAVIAGDDGRVAAPGSIWAIGDVAAWWDPGLGRHLRHGHQLPAIQQGQLVARRIATGDREPLGHPFFWADLHGVRIAAAGRFDDAELAVEGDDDSFLVRAESAGFAVGVLGWNAPGAFHRARRDLGAQPART